MILLHCPSINVTCASTRTIMTSPRRRRATFLFTRNSRAKATYYTYIASCKHGTAAEQQMQFQARGGLPASSCWGVLTYGELMSCLDYCFQTDFHYSCTHQESARPLGDGFRADTLGAVFWPQNTTNAKAVSSDALWFWRRGRFISVVSSIWYEKK